MPEEEGFVEFRLAKVEGDVKDLKSEMSCIRNAQMETKYTLDNLLVAFGELKESVNKIKDRPSQYWDKIIAAVISSLVTGFITYTVLSNLG
jgi:hypothetical protein